MKSKYLKERDTSDGNYNTFIRVVETDETVYGISQEELTEDNPSVSRDLTLQIGQKLTISGSSPSKIDQESTVRQNNETEFPYPTIKAIS